MIKIVSSKDHFININKLETTYFFLTYFRKYTSQLLGVIIEALIDKYKEIEEEEMQEHLKKITLAEIEFEILCKTMEELETLASICNAFIDEDSKIMDNLLNFGKKGYPNVDDTLEKFEAGNSIFIKLLTYPEIESLDIDIHEKELLQRIYVRNIEALKIFFGNIRKFYRKNIKAYNKHKHSKTFCIVPFISEYNNHYAESIIFTKDKNGMKEFVMHSKLIFNQYVKISKQIYEVINDLLQNRTNYMEFSGYKLLPTQSYFDISETTKSVLNQLNKKILEKYGGVYKTNISLNFKIETNLDIINKNTEFYLQEFYNSRLSKDPIIEKLAQELYVRDKLSN